MTDPWKKEDPLQDAIGFNRLSNQIFGSSTTTTSYINYNKNNEIHQNSLSHLRNETESSQLEQFGFAEKPISESPLPPFYNFNIYT